MSSTATFTIGDCERTISCGVLYPRANVRRWAASFAAWGQILRLFASVAFLAAVGLHSDANEICGLAPAECGVYSWCSWSPRLIHRDNSPHVVGVPIVMHWDKLEPEPGRYEFDDLLRRRLEQARENNFRTMLMIWVGPAAPRWIYEQGVPEVECTPTVNPMGKVRTATYPYYLDENHRRLFFRLIREFGKYVLALPDELKDRIAFLQVAEGSTGDGWGYKGTPLDSKYHITDEQWGAFRIATWQKYKDAFSADGQLQVRLLVNDDSSGGPQHQWLWDNLDVIGCKQGMFSHGYHISNTRRRLSEWTDFKRRATLRGRRVFVRGEQDGEWQHCGWSRQNPLEGLYWSALFALHCGVDVWNVPAAACSNPDYAPAFEFFNKYAGRHDPRTASAAFCALRQGLDASDTDRFPESGYGPAKKNNVQRYVRIAHEYAERGEIQGDPICATGGGMKNRQRKDYNDVGWGIWPGNYGRFLEQIDPERGSLGLWHVESSGSTEQAHFGRFARALDHASDRNSLRFRLADNFFADASKPQKIRLRIVYLDRVAGSWSLEYHSAIGENRTACHVPCSGSMQWKEKTLELDDAVFAHPDYDLKIFSRENTDIAFHILELGRSRKVP